MLSDLFGLNSANSVFTFWDVMMNCSVSVILIWMISFTYMKTHKGPTYSQSFVHTFFLMGVTVAIIMMIIGSNIARAFTLVGALSIIRFRTAVKDSRDTGYIFLAIAAGMAAGTGFYLVGFFSTIFICFLLIMLSWSDFGKKEISEKLLKIEFPLSADYDTLLDQTFKKNLNAWSLINTEKFIQKNLCELTYIVSFKRKVSEKDFLNAIGKLSGVSRVDLLYNDQSLNI